MLKLGVDWLFGAKAPDPARALYRHGLVKVALGRNVDH